MTETDKGPWRIGALLGLHLFAIATMWVEARWALSVFEIGLLILGVYSLLHISGGRISHWLAWPFAFMAVWPLGQLLFGRTPYSLATELAALKFSCVLASFLAAYCWLREPLNLDRWRAGLVGGLSVMAAIAIVQQPTSEGRVLWLVPTRYSDIMGTVPNPNQWAVLAEIVFPVALLSALRGGWRTPYGVASAILFLSALASGSKAGAILIVLQLFIMLSLNKQVWKRSNGVLIGLFGSLALIAAVAFGALHDPAGFQVRRDLLIAGWRMFLEHPFAGFGLGSWQYVYPAYEVADFGTFIEFAHCDWIEWAAEGGIPFVACAAAIFATLIKSARRSAWAVGVATAYLHASVDFPFSRLAIASLAAACCAAAMVEDAPARS